MNALRDGALILTSEEYEAIEGPTVSRERLEKAGINRWLSKAEVLRHPVWKELAGEDTALLKAYRNMVFAEGKRRWQYDAGMGIYVTNEAGPSLRAWMLGRLGDRSNADDGGRLGDDGARLVGGTSGRER